MSNDDAEEPQSDSSSSLLSSSPIGLEILIRNSPSSSRRSPTILGCPAQKTIIATPHRPPMAVSSSDDDDDDDFWTAATTSWKNIIQRHALNWKLGEDDHTSSKETDEKETADFISLIVPPEGLVTADQVQVIDLASSSSEEESSADETLPTSIIPTLDSDSDSDTTPAQLPSLEAAFPPEKSLEGVIPPSVTQIHPSKTQPSPPPKSPPRTPTLSPAAETLSRSRPRNLKPSLRPRSAPPPKKTVRFDPTHFQNILIFPRGTIPIYIPTCPQFTLPLQSTPPPSSSLSVKPVNFIFTERISLGSAPVRLESISLAGSPNPVNPTLLATIRVANLGLNKQVQIRWSIDNWQTWNETGAGDMKWGGFVPGTTTEERFFVTFSIGDSTTPPQQQLTQEAKPYMLKFAIKYNVLESTHWDNNAGRDYILDLVPTLSSPPISTPKQKLRWMMNPPPPVWSQQTLNYKARPYNPLIEPVIPDTPPMPTGKSQRRAFMFLGDVERKRRVKGEGMRQGGVSGIV